MSGVSVGKESERVGEWTVGKDNVEMCLKFDPGTDFERVKKVASLMNEISETCFCGQDECESTGLFRKRSHRGKISGFDIPVFVALTPSEQFSGPVIWLEPHSNNSQGFTEKARGVIQATNKLLELSGLDRVPSLPI
jgi:hypothetical protein